MECCNCKNKCSYIPIISRSPRIFILDQLPILPNSRYINGDIIVISSTGDMYTLENGMWVFQGSLRGPPGTPGEPGSGPSISFITDENHSDFPLDPNEGDVVIFLPYGQTYTFIDGEWVPNTTIGIINEVDSCIDESGIVQRKAKGILIDDDQIQDLDFITAPKGEGANIAQFPDGTVENGDCRGPYSTDFQKLRTSPDQVSNGLASGILSGQNNRTEGENSGIVSGTGNLTEGDNSFIGTGKSNTIDENSTNSNVVSGNENTITNSLNSSTLVGNNTTINDSDNSNILSGEQVNINNSNNSSINTSSQSEINNSDFSKINNSQQSIISNSNFSSVEFANESNVEGELPEYTASATIEFIPDGILNIDVQFIQRKDTIFLYISFSFIVDDLERGYDSTFIPLFATSTPGQYRGVLPQKEFKFGSGSLFYVIPQIILTTDIPNPTIRFENFQFINTSVRSAIFTVETTQVDTTSSNNHINSGKSNIISNSNSSVIISGDENLIGTIGHEYNLMYGRGLKSVNNMCITFGQYNDTENILYPLPRSIPIGINLNSECANIVPEEIIFCISYGTDDENRENLFVINKRGDVWTKGTFFSYCGVTPP